ncbi:hypothetical protein ACFFMN_01065 [Planobispora siamensis]|uniref:FtsX-like permease family protein n=1 Tax=Planobispora siamensis TaxID=936338 RepID=A0A8J3SI49_9ACTN|nr:hypothetical protein [Planobispora siamensis]GIH93405.1 hypothetical protein Psi01_40350 [Planobispora siamensis]
MIGIARMLERGRSRRERVRGRLMAAGAALATFLLCAAANLTAFEIDEHHDYYSVFTDGMMRPGTMTALVLLTAPALAFVYQVSRLAAATRQRRLAALRLAGATPGETRLLGAYETGRSALLGALAGAAVYLPVNLAAQWIFNERVSPLPVPYVPGAGSSVPAVPLPLVAAAIVLVTAGGVLSGLAAGRHVVASPLEVVRRARLTRPRALDLLLVVAGAGLVFAGFNVVEMDPIWRSGVYVIGAGACVLVFGLVLATTWVIRAAARSAGRRAGSAETLLSARMVEADPRAWARALSVVGLTVFLGSAAGWAQTFVLFDVWSVSTFRMVIYVLVDLALLGAMVTSAAALVVHQAEELLDHRRSFASLAASGVPIASLGRVLTRQALIAALPVCLVAGAAGVAALSWISFSATPTTAWAYVYPFLRAAVVTALGVAAAVLVSRAARPVLRRAAAPGELRFE